MKPTIEIITPSINSASEVCNVIIQSILQVCAADYQNDSGVLNEWLANKTPENLATWISSSSNHSFAALNMETGKIVGFALMNIQGEILLNYLLPSYLHQGIGKYLLNNMQDAAKKLQLPALFVVSTITAKEFYEKNGFIQNGMPEKVGPVIGDFPLIKYL